MDDKLPLRSWEEKGWSPQDEELHELLGQYGPYVSDFLMSIGAAPIYKEQALQWAGQQFGEQPADKDILCGLAARFPADMHKVGDSIQINGRRVTWASANDKAPAELRTRWGHGWIGLVLRPSEPAEPADAEGLADLRKRLAEIDKVRQRLGI